MLLHYNNLSLNDIEGEIWKPDVDFPDAFAFSNYGRMKSLSRKYVRKDGVVGYVKEKIRRQHFDKNHYFGVVISYEGKFKLLQVHRRVALSFIPNPEKKATVNHKNGNPKDNRVENLEWNTQAENNLHSIRELGVVRNTSGISSYWKGKKRPDASAWTSLPRINFRGENSKSSKKIKCDTLGINFFSIKNAQEILGISTTSILKVLKGRKTHVDGLTFRYL